MTPVLLHTLRFLGARPAPRCVCGHPRAAHRDTVMSVRLPVGLVAYTDPVTRAAPRLLYDSPAATVTQEQCHCGCTIWEPMNR